MSDRWYFLQNGVTYGPVPTAQLKELAGKGMLRPPDRLWPEGVDRSEAVPAAAAIDFASVAPAPGPVPDWLADVARLEEPPPPEPPNEGPLPRWIEDLRRTEPAGRPARKPAPPRKTPPRRRARACAGPSFPRSARSPRGRNQS